MLKQEKIPSIQRVKQCPNSAIYICCFVFTSIRWFAMMEIQLYVALFFLKFDVTVHDNIPDYVSSTCNSLLLVLSVDRILES